MANYTKLFHSILDSSIWRESKETRLVWITMLAMTDENGKVRASVPGLADRAKVSLKECVEALKVLMSPDKWSSDKANEGIRVEEIEGGWQVLNHSKYRALMSKEERREYNRIKQAERRERLRLAEEAISNLPAGSTTKDLAEALERSRGGELSARESVNRKVKSEHEADKAALMKSPAYTVPAANAEPAAPQENGELPGVE